MKKQTPFADFFRIAAIVISAAILSNIGPLPRPAFSQEGKQVALSADFSETVGKIKPVNGTNLGPRLITSKYNAHRE
ncbi:MAG: hypothetical protein IKT12_04585, partial [Thermoguttaceae bacterium]|nr:hypothetical protein [Thermoguttaceae bacterium]